MSPARCTAMLLTLAAAAIGCGDDSAPASRETRRMETPTKPAPSDAAPADAAPVMRAKEPASDYHLDVASSARWRPTHEKPAESRILRLTLRSTPPGATALVDGMPIGPTPTYWEGPATGRPRNFVFTLPGHNMARYRFVPTTDGVVHATLKKLAADTPDAGPEAEDSLAEGSSGNAPR